MKRQNKYEPDFKTQVVLGLISEKISLAEVCRKHNICQQVVSRWKMEFLKKAPEIFRSKKVEQNEQEQKIAELERMVGKLTMQLELLKKTSQIWESV